MRRALLLPLVLLLPTASSAEGSPPSVETAIAQQAALLTEEPTNALAFNDLGNLLLLAKRPAEAEAAYRRATELDGSLISPRFNLGLLLSQRGSYTEAAESFRQVLESDPEHAWSHYQLGRISEIEGNNRKALAGYSEAFRLDPRLSFADVNPQVLDSQLTTRALLALDAGAASAGEAPRLYEDPFRIASLLLPKPPEEEAEDPALDSASNAPTSSSRPGSDDPSPSDETEASKSLSQRDLERSQVGQADPPAVDAGDRGRSLRRPTRRGSGRAADVTRVQPNRPSGHLTFQRDENQGTDEKSIERSTGQVRTRLVPNL